MGGFITMPTRKTVTGKQVWRCDLLKKKFGYALLVALYPFMGIRRKAKIEGMLRSYANVS